MALRRGPDEGQGCNPFTGLLSPSLAYPHHGDSVGVSPLCGEERPPPTLQFMAWPGHPGL